MLKSRALALICVFPSIAGGEGACFVRRRKLKVLAVPTAMAELLRCQLLSTLAGVIKHFSFAILILVPLL
jgi:hypothetical protein